MRLLNQFFTTALLFLVSTPFLCGQETDSLLQSGIFDLLVDDKAVEIEIEADLNELLLKSKKSNDYLEATFSFQKNKKDKMTLPVKVRGRGRFRRMKCEFPPLKLKFRKDVLAGVDLNEFNELKLVTHCLGEQEASKELIWREELVYKLYNIITPYSFRTQLVRVTYQNTNNRPKRIKGWGILIEDSDALEYRIGGKKTDAMGIPDSCLNVAQERINSLFNYMIGNCDWDYQMLRNVELIALADTNVIVTPYDFDFSGLVSAPYARPNSDVGQRNIRERVYMGHAVCPDDLLPAAQLFLEKREAMMQEINDHPYLSRESKDDIKGYLEDFFSAIESKEAMKDQIFQPETQQEEKK